MRDVRGVEVLAPLSGSLGRSVVRASAARRVQVHEIVTFSGAGRHLVGVRRGPLDLVRVLAVELDAPLYARGPRYTLVVHRACSPLGRGPGVLPHSRGLIYAVG